MTVEISFSVCVSSDMYLSSDIYTTVNSSLRTILPQREHVRRRSLIKAYSRFWYVHHTLGAPLYFTVWVNSFTKTLKAHLQYTIAVRKTAVLTCCQTRESSHFTKIFREIYEFARMVLRLFREGVGPRINYLGRVYYLDDGFALSKLSQILGGL